MTGYLVNFSLYTLAMVGVIFCALFVFKNVVTNQGFSKKSEYLKIEETMNLSARKTLYVIKAGKEKFLIASDIDKTTLISKLEDGEKGQNKIRVDKSDELTSTDGIESLEEFASIINFKKNNTNKKPVMRELVRKLGSV